MRYCPTECIVAEPADGAVAVTAPAMEMTDHGCAPLSFTMSTHAAPRATACSYLDENVVAPRSNTRTDPTTVSGALSKRGKPDGGSANTTRTPSNDVLSTVKYTSGCLAVELRRELLLRLLPPLLLTSMALWP